MSRENPVAYATIASGSKVSGDIAVARSRSLGIISPVVTSCALYFQANVDTTSAGFTSVTNGLGSGTLTWNVGPGSASMHLNETMVGFPFMRLETSVAQTDTRTFSIVSKL